MTSIKNRNVRQFVKAPPCKYYELKFALFGYGVYLGAIWWNVGNAVDIDGGEHWLGYRPHYSPHLSWSKLVRGGGVSFWDEEYF